MSFNRGYYELGSLPSRQVAQRDLPNQTRLKLRRQQEQQPSGESVEGKLERLKKELEEKRQSLAVPAAGAGDEEVATGASEFDDADDEVLIQPPREQEEEAVAGKEAESELDQELEREMERVKREKRQKVQEEEDERAQGGGGLFAHNPLVSPPAAAASSASSSSTTGLVRRWDDDVIFRNQARGELDLSKEKRLINDTTKSDTHRQFLKRHIL